jgi:hypothetical protein
MLTTHNAPAEVPQVSKHRFDLNETIGSRELCAWQPAPGTTWIQCRSPKHANRLAKRSDARLVVQGMMGGYLKTFEFSRPLSWAVGILQRYTQGEDTANEALGHAVLTETGFSSAGRGNI